MAGRMGEGDVIAGRFAIERLVARGGMGSVYRAIDRESGLPVALKIIDADLNGPDGEARFAREVRLLAELNNPRIVRYVGHGEAADGRAYLAMEWLDGEDLRAALARSGRLSLRAAVLALEGAARALEAVHAQDIVHRDLKPANLFLRGGKIDDLVLLDFGIARRLSGTRRLTSTGALLGTPHYMAPEQASDIEQVRPATDVFSLGCIFYECLTGRPPFDASHAAGVLAKILFDTPEPVQRLRPSLPRPFAELLARALSKDPARRPKDASALLRELALLPPPGEEGEATIDARATPLPDEGGEQTLVCAVLAVFPPSRPAPEADPMTTWLALAPDGISGAQSALRRFGFTVEGLADGSLVATVSSGSAATDQARIAARGALYLRELLPEARIAVATGRALLWQATRVGEAVDRAARVLERARDTGGGQETEGVWLDEVTAGLLDARFITSPRNGAVLLRGERPAADESRLLLGKPTPCVGRELELAQLEGLMARVVDDSAADAALIIAPPGAGKSRLRHELLRRVAGRFPEADPLIGRGDPLTAGSPYGLVSDALRRRAEVRVGDDPAAARDAILSRLCGRVEPSSRRRVGEFLGELCGIPFPADDSPPLRAARSDPRVMSEQITHAFLDWLAAECAEHPVILVLEDMQWGDVLTVKLIESALRERAQAPLFVLALGRPEVKDVFPALFSEKAQELILRPLSRKASERLVREVLGDAIPRAALARVVDLAGGNALFLEELIRAAAEGKAGDVPGTVLAMLQARLARLAPEARRVLRAGSIFGETFWVGAVRGLIEDGGQIERMQGWVEHLADVELIEPRRESRFPSEIEVGFRHALVRDAAYSLLASAERRAWHLAAGVWLEAAGEADAMVLAEHAREGGDPGRAITFYTRAADQSLERNDLDEALARANRGIACGAEGEALGALEGVRALSYYGLGKWPECGSAGLAALDLLPRGSLRACRIAEKLCQVLPQIHEVERFEALVRDIQRTEPSDDARTAFTCALSALSFGFTIVGERERAMSAAELVQKAGDTILDNDPYARGITRLHRGAYNYFFGADPYLGAVLFGQAAEDFEISQVLHMQSLALAGEGGARSAIGDHVAAEERARRSLAVAERLRDAYQATNARFYLSVIISEGGGPDRLEEAEGLARAVLDAHVSATYDGVGHMVLAGIALSKGEFARAEAEARTGRELVIVFPAYSIVCATHLIRALLGQGRAGEVVAVANEGLAVLQKSQGTGFSEMPFRAAAAEALYEAGEREQAARVIREALRQIALRASKFPDAALRDRYVSGNAAHRRASELARAWGIDENSLLIQSN